MSEEVFRKSDCVVTRKVAGGTFLVPVKGRIADLQRMFSLNPVAECIWESMDGTRSQQDLVGIVVDRFEVTADLAARDIAELIRQLQEQGLVESP
jgi:hypothetical protein